MGSISSPAEAVARIAYIASDVVLSVQPSLATESEFSHHLSRYATNKAKGFVAGSVPQIIPLRHNADPLLSAYAPLRAGRLVAVTTSSSILLSSIPHLYKLAQYPVVLHVSLQTPHSDYSEISSIRQCGFTFLHSETLQEAQDIALTAHALAIKSGKGVIHFFDPSNSIHDNPIAPESRDVVQKLLSLDSLRQFAAQDSEDRTLYADDGRVVTVPELVSPATNETSVETQTTPTLQSPARESSTRVSSAGQSSASSSNRDSSADSALASSTATSIDLPVDRPITAADIFKNANEIWSLFQQLTGRTYHAIEYSGNKDAEAALFIFGSTGIFVDALDDAGTPDDLVSIGVITARLYRPWPGAEIVDSIPKTIKRIAVLEQVKRKTTKWGPTFLDLLSSLNPGIGGKNSVTLVGYRLGQLEPATAMQALRGIVQNLSSPTPIQSLSVGHEPGSASISSGPHIEQPKSENAYLKILNQLFGDRLYLANQLGAKHAGVSSTIAASPEYGFGSLLARIEHRKRFVEEVKDASSSREFITDSPKTWLSKWALSVDDVNKANETAPEVIARLSTDGSRLSTHLLSSKGLFFHESQWLIGSDAWAYDLGNSGIHHVIASGANVNMLIIDSQPYSEHAAADSTRRKKDIGLYAMNFGNAYVASVAVYSSYTQVLEAMIEADRFNGPSVVVAYLPYNKEDDSALTILQETKKAVDTGYWPLYRWDPSNEVKGEPTFSLDSERVKRDLEEFLRRDNQLTQLVKRHPEFSANLSESYGTEVRKLQKRRAKDAYEQLLEGLYGAPLTVLFASDNGNAESLAKRFIPP